MDTPALFDRLRQEIWDSSLDELPRWRAVLLRALRTAVAVGRDWWDGQISMRATSLVYTTLLSIVPLLAFTFSVVKAFGVNNIIAPVLHHLLAPLGEKGGEVASRILEFVQNMRVGVLGSLGLVFLIYTVVALIGQMEDSLNSIWRVEEPRSWSQRFSKYVSVLLIGPILVVAAIGITASISSARVVQWLLTVHPFGDIAYVASQFVPYLLAVAAFTFVYVLMPNTRVRLLAALTGGVVAGVLWQLAGAVFTSLVVGSTRYAAIYSSFAILIMFLIWIYIGWLILLMGASVSFYFQYPQYLRVRSKPPRLSGRVSEKLALLVTYLVGVRYRQGEQAWGVEQLSAHLDIPRETIAEVVSALQRQRVLLPTGDNPPRFLPSRALEAIPVKDALQAVRMQGEQHGIAMRHLRPVATVDETIMRVDRAVGRALEQVTVQDLCSEEDLEPTEPTSPR
ncbi:MAG: YihY/virulence factor BrkB family protein [Chromatiaceae bacterium]